MMRGMVRVVGVGLLAFGGGCSISEEGLDPQMSAAGRPRSRPSRRVGMAPPAQPVAQPVMRVRDVEVNQLEVGVLFAHSVRAKNGVVVVAGPAAAGRGAAAQLGGEDLKRPHLMVDVLYADEVKAEPLSVRELHAVEVRIDRENQSEVQ